MRRKRSGNMTLPTQLVSAGYDVMHPAAAAAAAASGSVGKYSQNALSQGTQSGVCTIGKMV
jgi:hypothetical protein